MFVWLSAAVLLVLASSTYNTYFTRLHSSLILLESVVWIHSRLCLARVEGWSKYLITALGFTKICCPMPLSGLVVPGQPPSNTYMSLLAAWECWGRNCCFEQQYAAGNWVLGAFIVKVFTRMWELLCVVCNGVVNDSISERVRKVIVGFCCLCTSWGVIISHD